MEVVGRLEPKQACHLRMVRRLGSLAVNAAMLTCAAKSARLPPFGLMHFGI